MAIFASFQNLAMFGILGFFNPFCAWITFSELKEPFTVCSWKLEFRTQSKPFFAIMPCYSLFKTTIFALFKIYAFFGHKGFFRAVFGIEVVNIFLSGTVVCFQFC